MPHLAMIVVVTREDVRNVTNLPYFLRHKIGKGACEGILVLVPTTYGDRMPTFAQFATICVWISVQWLMGQKDNRELLLVLSRVWVILLHSLGDSSRSRYPYAVQEIHGWFPNVLTLISYFSRRVTIDFELGERGQRRCVDADERVISQHIYPITLPKPSLKTITHS